MNLSEVSQTAFLALSSRVVESEKKTPVFNDPMAILCFDKLMSAATAEEKSRIMKWKRMYARFPGRDARMRALTAKYFDTAANQYITDNPGCTVVNLACGLDTRFWRIQHEKCTYIEFDLPEMIELKKEVLNGYLEYDLFGCSVFDTAWIDRVTKNGNSHFLLIAEALLYYLPKQAVVKLFEVIAQKFAHSQIVFDMAPEIYTKELWKKIIQLESKAWDINVAILSGIKDPQEVETFANGLKVIKVGKGNVGPILTVDINAG